MTDRYDFARPIRYLKVSLSPGHKRKRRGKREKEKRATLLTTIPENESSSKLFLPYAFIELSAITKRKGNG